MANAAVSDRVIDPTVGRNSRGLRRRLRDFTQTAYLSLSLPRTVGEIKFSWREAGHLSRGRGVGDTTFTAFFFLTILVFGIIIDFSGSVRDWLSVALIAGGLAFNVFFYRRRVFRVYQLVAAKPHGDALMFEMKEGEPRWVYLDRANLPDYWFEAEGGGFPIERVEAWFEAEDAATRSKLATELQVSMVNRARRAGAFHTSAK